jgi:hypothetical protein
MDMQELAKEELFIDAGITSDLLPTYTFFTSERLFERASSVWHERGFIDEALPHSHMVKLQ